MLTAAKKWQLELKGLADSYRQCMSGTANGPVDPVINVVLLVERETIGYLEVEIAVLVLYNALNYIVVVMVRFLRCITALILPVALVSLFSACLSLCATYVDNANAATISVSESDSWSGEDSECCSVTEGQSILPERMSYSVAPLTIVQNPFSYVRVTHNAPVTTAVSFSSSSPPLTLLGTLRI